MKRAYSDITEDGNTHGLRVCIFGCSDNRDPYRLPARQPEKIAIRYPRPDEPIGETHDTITTDPNIVNDIFPTAGEFGIAPETSLNPLDGNLDNLSP
jgi:hypothetical protein